jgi:hypothetical protein
VPAPPQPDRRRPRRWVRAPHIGRRGASLLFLALLDLVFGFSLAAPAPEALRSPTAVFISGVAPLWFWALLWTTVGLLCLVGAFIHRDRVAFAAAVSVKVLWGSLYLAGWATGGLDRGWAAAVIWLPMAAWIAIISGWPEKPPRRPMGRKP